MASRRLVLGAWRFVFLLFPPLALYATRLASCMLLDLRAYTHLVYAWSAITAKVCSFDD